MSFVLKDRVKETTTVVGTGPATLLGSPSKFIPFSNIGDTNTTFYCIVHQILNEWEVGLGTYSLGANTLTRNTVKASSSANVAVTFSAGTKDIFCCYTAEDAIWLNGPLGTPISGNLVNCSGYPATLQTDKIIPIDSSVSGNALTVKLNPITLDFRSPTLTSSATNVRTIATQLTLTVPSGVTLGLVANQQARLLIIAMDNSGTVELAIANIAGGNNLDETTLLTTNAIATVATGTGVIAVTTGILTISGSPTGTWQVGQFIYGTGVPAGTYITSLGTGTGGNGTYYTNCYTAVSSTAMTGCAGYGVYSTTARSNLPFRVVGFIDITEATAGTWATAPSTIQGCGGQALAALSSVGYGQTLRNVTSSRVSGTTYYNTTGKPIFIFIIGPSTYTATLIINGRTLNANTYGVNSLIPVNASYSVTLGGGALTSWWELS